MPELLGVAYCREFDSIQGLCEPRPSTGFAQGYLNGVLTKSPAEKDKGMSAEPVPEAAQPERLTEVLRRSGALKQGRVRG